MLVDEGRQVLAEVDGEPIRLDDLLSRIRTLSFEERARTNDPDESIRLSSRKAIVRNLALEKALAAEAKRRNIEVSDEEVEEAFHSTEEDTEHGNSLMEEAGGRAHHGHSHEGEHSKRDLARMREKLAIEKMLAQELSEEVLQRYYAEHPDEFAISPSLTSYELLVVDPAHSAFADSVRHEAIETGDSLADVVAGMSNPPPIIFLGATPLAPLSNLEPSMRQKVANLEVGQVSEPFVLQPFGKKQYVVARILSEVDRQPFEAVRGSIYFKLYEAFLDELERKHNVVYYEEKLNYQLGR